MSRRSHNKKVSRPRRSNTRFPQAQSRSTARSQPRVSPDEMDVPLTFRKTGNINTGDGVYYMKFNPNCAYDVDPTLASTETYGFDEYAHFYSYYRVISYSYVISLANMNSVDGTQCLNSYVLNTNTDPTLDGTRFDLYSTNPHNQSALLSASNSGKSCHVFRKKLKCSTVAGDPSVETADSYRSLTNSVPSDKLWLTFAFESLNTEPNMHLSYDVLITMKVRFYSRVNDLSLATLVRAPKDKRDAMLDALAAKRQAYVLQKTIAYVKPPSLLSAWKALRGIQ